MPLTDGVGTLLYFSTPDCTLCHNAQSPVIEQLKTNMGKNLQIVEINAYEQPRMAQDWGILSVPATVVLGKDGKPRSINYGFTPYNHLIQQIES
ncbi:MAG: thioredoxin family protein [Chloroflexi bacterium]|nr:thioredoxin family protein [Chloroflexota bacterium]